VIQRVREARVTVAGATVGEIGRGLMVLVGIGGHDTVRDADWMVDRFTVVRRRSPCR